MRLALAHINHAAIGGTERVLHEVSRRLALRGHEVSILCRRHVAASHPSIQFVVLHGLALGSAWRMWAFAQEVERHVRSTDYDVVFALGKTWSHDVIRTSGGCHATWIERRQLARGELAHAAPRLLEFKDRAALEIERRAYGPGNYRRVIANSRLVADDMQRRHGTPLQAIDVVHNGVDLAVFRPHSEAERLAWRRSVGLAAEHFVVLFLGNGFERKGLGRTLEAFTEVAAARPLARLVVVGHDSEQERHAERVARLQLDGRVLFLGRRNDPADCLAASDLHVMPTWYDSFGFTVLEALACGVPVVTTDGAGSSELLDQDVHGKVVPWSVSGVELGAALLPWCDLERTRNAASLARERALQFSFDSTMERMIEVLESVGRARQERTLAPLHAPL